MKKNQQKTMEVWEYHIRQNIEGWNIKKGGERIKWLINEVRRLMDEEYKKGIEDNKKNQQEDSVRLNN